MSIQELHAVPAPQEPGEDRLPPQDVNAERSVLGGMLLSKDAISDCVEVVRGPDFYRPAHETVYEAILDLYGRGEPADAVTVADELTKRGELNRIGGAAYLHQLISAVPTAANAGYYAQIVAERAVLRRLVEAGTRIVQLGYAQGGGDVEDIVNAAQAEVYGVSDRNQSEDYVRVGDLLEATVDEIEFASGKSGEMTGVPTGFIDLDQLTNGLHPGQMIVIAARPAMGKSTLGLDIARCAAIRHGLASVVFSLEMSRTEITMRLLSAEAQIQLQHMRKGSVRDEEWQRIAATTGRISEAPLYIDDSPNMSLMEIRAKCRRLKQRHDLKLVVVDYLQLMSSGKRVESRQQEVSEFSRALKLLAKELEVPVIAISQLNRGPEQRTDKRPLMADLRESGCLTAETRVLRADTGAETSLGELHAAGAREVPVWALDESLRYVRRPLTHVFPTGTRPVFRLTLASGKQVRATANHPFLTYAGWEPLGELRAGTKVGVPQHVPGPEQLELWDERRLVAVARVLGDGARDDGALAAKGSAPAKGAGSAKGAASTKGAALTKGDGSTTDNGRGKRGDKAKGAGAKAGSAHRDVAAGQEVERGVPESVFHAPKQQIAMFLQALWGTNGSVTIKRSGRGGRIRYGSSSRRLVEDLSRLLLRFGISTRIKRGSAPVRPGEPAGAWLLDVAGADSQRRFLAEIGVAPGAGRKAGQQLLEIVRGGPGDKGKGRAAAPGGAGESGRGGRGGKRAGRSTGEGGAGRREERGRVDEVPSDVWESMRRILADSALGEADAQGPLGVRRDGSAVYRSSAGSGAGRLGQMAAVLDRAELELHAINDVLWDEVRSIEPDGVEQVFDATVVGGHNFIANGIAVHNSIEQDADMVILLHRDEAYERESQRAGEADLIVAKHRNGPTDTIVVAFQGHYSRFTNMAPTF